MLQLYCCIAMNYLASKFQNYNKISDHVVLIDQRDELPLQTLLQVTIFIQCNKHYFQVQSAQYRSWILFKSCTYK